MNEPKAWELPDPDPQRVPRWMTDGEGMAAEIDVLRAERNRLQQALAAVIEEFVRAEAWRRKAQQLEAQRDAARALVGRLWCGDGPEDQYLNESIAEWLRRIPRAEADELNAEVEVYADFPPPDFTPIAVPGAAQ